uniref:Uncharacterized protein n=1 Tax=Tarenaya spinosa TaxID=228870 RepID=Q1KUZ5_9ROSI|nr:hypothetical protein [Tarenaya spinosa]
MKICRRKLTEDHLRSRIGRWKAPPDRRSTAGNKSPSLPFRFRETSFRFPAEKLEGFNG